MRRTFHMQLNPGSGAEYARLHDPVPPSIIEQLGRAGVRDYEIYLDGDDVFGVFEYDDPILLEREFAHDVAPAWTAAVVRIIAARNLDTELPPLVGLPLVFRFDGEAAAL